MMYDLNGFTLTSLRYTGSNYVINAMGTILRKRRDSLHSRLRWFLVSFGNQSTDGIISTMTNLSKQASWAWLEPRHTSGSQTTVFYLNRGLR